MAAVTVAQRVADEMGRQLGGVVGYAVRFDNKCSAGTCIKFCTDGLCRTPCATPPPLTPRRALLSLARVAPPPSLTTSGRREWDGRRAVEERGLKRIALGAREVSMCWVCVCVNLAAA